MRKIAVSLVRTYQALLSPDIGLFKDFYGTHGVCCMYPTCSEYMILAIEKYGSIKGFYKGLVRITRCHPYQKNLIDTP